MKRGVILIVSLVVFALSFALTQHVNAQEEITGDERLFGLGVDPFGENIVLRAWFDRWGVGGRFDYLLSSGFFSLDGNISGYYRLRTTDGSAFYMGGGINLSVTAFTSDLSLEIVPYGVEILLAPALALVLEGGLDLGFPFIGFIPDSLAFTTLLAFLYYF